MSAKGVAILIMNHSIDDLGGSQAGAPAVSGAISRMIKEARK